mgnify:CR=1 FL=1
MQESQNQQNGVRNRTRINVYGANTNTDYSYRDFKPKQTERWVEEEGENRETISLVF